MSKRYTPYILALLFCAISVGAGAKVDLEALFQPLSPMAEHKTTTSNIVNALASRHYATVSLNDELSTETFDRYLESLDPSRSFFTSTDISEFETDRYQLDNSLRKSEVTFAYKVFNRYLERIQERLMYVIQLLESEYEDFDFTRKEYLALDRDKAPWLKTRPEMDDLWRKRAKNDILSLRLAKKEPAEIRTLLLKRYRNRLTRAGQTNSEDVFQLYMNAFTRSYDPHTQYFSPRASENFNINMSLSLEGIGAVLQREDEFTRVVSLIHAGPAEKSGQLKPNDKIVAVGQDYEGELVDVIGWRVDEVVALIRGKKDTVVRLGVIPAGSAEDADLKIIPLTRNKVKIEEQSAKSEVIEIEQFGFTHKIGVIDIPTFYIDFKAWQDGDPEYKSTTRDVFKLLAGLKKEGVEGIVIDLRDNGGGSLQEAKSLTGLFIDRGPTVQIRSKNNRIDILNDRDFRTAYDGPLGVLVNRLSASASEIFAGAIQDYKRGLIIGNQTFGKGTVQSLIPLNRGQLKLTQAKFYRISGESTQHQGIVPDITYPPSHNPEEIGESTLDDPLPWDQIDATGFRTRTNLSELLPDLQSRHKLRSTYNPDFDYLRKAIDYQRQLAKIEKISLNEEERISKKGEIDSYWVKLENEKRTAKGLPEIASLDDLEVDNTLAANVPSTGVTPASDGESDQNSEGSLTGNEMAGVIDNPNANQALSSPASVVPTEDLNSDTDSEDAEEPDYYIIESGNILLDMISMKKRTASKLKAKQAI